MSYSKPLPSFTFDLLRYLNRNQLERFSIVSRSVKNFIERYFHSKPYRIFNHLWVEEGSYALYHNLIYWHPNREDYSVQQFLAGQKCSAIVDPWDGLEYYSFAEMCPYLGPTIRITKTTIYVVENTTYNPEHIAEMESIKYLWRDHRIFIRNGKSLEGRIIADDLKPYLNSPTILQCRNLWMDNAHFSFKDYKVLYNAEVFLLRYRSWEEIDRQIYWQQFVEQPGVKPVFLLLRIRREKITNLVDQLSKGFSSAVLQNAFKIVFVQSIESEEPLTEFRETNNISGEKLELKKGLPVECQKINLGEYGHYILERSSI